MKPIPETSLADIVTGAATQLLHERRQDAESRIRQILKRQEILAEELRKADAAAAKVRGRLEGSAKMIERLKAGEWQVLAEMEKALKQEQQPQKPGATTPADDET